MKYQTPLEETSQCAVLNQTWLYSNMPLSRCEVSVPAVHSPLVSGLGEGKKSSVKGPPGYDIVIQDMIL